VSLEEVSSLQRHSAKAINFGLIYGMSSFGLSKQLGVDKKSAEEYINRYFERYPKVKIYMDFVREKAAKHGFAETLFGRRVYLPDILSKNMMRRKQAERLAINAPMQGTAADIIKRAMITLQDWTEKHSSKVSMIMQVHDELVFEVSEDFVKAAKEVIQEKMEEAGNLSVATPVSIGCGNNWDEAH